MKHKSWSLDSHTWIIAVIICCLLCANPSESKCKSSESTTSTLSGILSNFSEDNENYEICYRGECVDESCECPKGWTGPLCNRCSGRVLLEDDSGFISDGPKNYSTETECSWLIQPSTRNVPIRLTFLEFASECGWDYLYLYDGDSVYAPLLATFNGLVLIQDEKQPRSFYPEVFATSGSAFLHFFSDIAYTMHGFNISYTVQTCPQNCSGHGTCGVLNSSVLCKCDPGWMGSACQHVSCPANCTQSTGQGMCTTQGDAEFCQCQDGYQGPGCAFTKPASQGFWTELPTVETNLNTARSSHSSVYLKGAMWTFGGIQFGDLAKANKVQKYNLTTNEWSIVDEGESYVGPTPRYGHSIIAYEDKLIMFGGRDVRTNITKGEVWEFSTTTYKWNKVSYTSGFFDPADNSSISPLDLWGHTGTLVEYDNHTSIMVVMFGYHPVFEYSGLVYEYDLLTRHWNIATTGGAFIEAAYGHSATLDPVSRGIFVHGGNAFLKRSSYGVTAATYFYNTESRNFRRLRQSPLARFLHTGVLIGGTIYMYGGCTHNDSESSTGALCFSTSLMAYHIACDTWEQLDHLEQAYQPNRYGHSAIAVDGATKMLVYAGYDSTMLGNILSFHVGSCSAFNASNCTEHHPGLSCTWNGTTCISADIFLSSANTSCNQLMDSASQCLTFDSCSSCLNSSSCKYCKGNCVDGTSACQNENWTMESECSDANKKNYCKRFRTCSQCILNEFCKWDSSCTVKDDNSTGTCQDPNPCQTASSCSMCTSTGGCMWCSNRRMCVTTTSYVIQFPYGECMKWINNQQRCPATTGCSTHRTCDTCQSDPFCGWCDDGSNTGLGTCQAGSYTGANARNQPSLNVISANNDANNATCPTESWFFTNCPICQCNGHSKCLNDTSDCEDCQGHTMGSQCQICEDGYFGDATNGGECDTCQCDNRATLCNNTTGTCFCSTKGQTGDKCEKCDNGAKYYGNPANNGTCFYRLLINYSFTFTLTTNHDRYVTAINFDNTPPMEINAELSFESQKPCNVRLTVVYNEKIDPTTSPRIKRETNESRQEEEVRDVALYREREVEVKEYYSVKKISYDFDASEFGFGDSTRNATVRIYVSNFTIPIQIQVSLVQTSSRLLVLLLILFSCFLVLLLLTALVWKLKMLYDACQHRRQHAEHLEQMAARPFSTIQLCFSDAIGTKQTLKNAVAAPVTQGIDTITEEKCLDGNASVVSVIFWMPSGNIDAGSLFSIDEDRSVGSYSDRPSDNSALAIGTAFLATSSRMDFLESQNSDSQAQSKADKLKVVFKRGKRRRANDAPGTSSIPQGCGQHYNESNNQSGEEIRDVPNDATPNNVTHRRSLRRGRSSFTSIRSSSVSPTGSGDRRSTKSRDDTESSIGPHSRPQPRPHPIVLAYDEPRGEKIEVTV